MDLSCSAKHLGRCTRYINNTEKLMNVLIACADYMQDALEAFPHDDDCEMLQMKK